MLRASRAILSFRRSAPRFATSFQSFHASSRREEEAKALETTKDPAKSGGWYTPAYGIAGGIAFAVPAIYYEWYIIDAETQLAACFIAFCGVFYKQFGQTIYEYLEEDNKQMLAEINAAEDAIIAKMEASVDDLKLGQGLVEQLEATKHLTEDTFAKLNETGKIKPLYKFKAQVEKLLTVIAAEEAANQEKKKIALMEEATAAVNSNFSSNKDLKKKSLANAVAILKGSKLESDPVKEAFLSFFAEKKVSAGKIDESSEILGNRTALVTKLNSVAMTEKFYFEFDASGKPKMIA
ncbi:hypothetical protein ACA910_014118 [Epithemia clementina (nom. ined.)]